MKTDPVRNEIIQKREAMHVNLCSDLSAQIIEKLIAEPIFTQSKRIAIYFAHRNEVITENIIQEIWQQNKNCFLPVLAPDTPNSLHFMPYNQDTKLQSNKFGILEPAWDVTACMPAEDLDLVIMPLVAFDANCHRIGMGAGYYDRTFAFLKASPRPKHPKLIGLGYELQKLGNINPEVWDVDLDVVFTENTVYQRK